jgi:hypothetical protein
MTEKEAFIRGWISKVSEKRPELSNFAICPFASTSKFKIKECRIDDIEPIDGYDVVIFIVENDLSLDDINQWVEIYNKIYKTWDFFEDCASYDTYIDSIQTNNGKYNLILTQPKEKLKKFRKKLASSDYYKHWDDEYLKEILGDDYNDLITG